MDIRQLDLNLLLLLDGLLREQNLSAAARQLGMSQPMASAGLRKLRDFFGDELFHSTGRGMRPTPFAESIAAPVRSALSTIEHDILRKPKFSPEESERVFTVTTSDIGVLIFILGACAAQIRNRLLALEAADELAMLNIQRDDHAQFFMRWRDLLLATLEQQPIASHPRSKEVASMLRTWDGRASTNSAAYRVLRAFRDGVERVVFEPFVSLVRAKQGPFNLSSVTNQLETPLWALVTQRPQHLLAPWYEDWGALLESAATAVLDAIAAAPSRSFVWGAINKLDMRHPLSAIMPWFSRWLDAPATLLPGDLHMPLAQTPRHGPVCRFVISPGSTDTAIAQICGGQASTPLSAYYLAGHREWLDGTPTPLGLGDVRYIVKLCPIQRNVQANSATLFPRPHRATDIER